MVVRLGSEDPALVLPAGSRLLHVGLPKTGTTALQRVAAQQRAELLRQGVLYPGRHYHHRKENYALIARPMGLGVTPPDRSLWDDLAAEVRAAGTRRVWLDSESFYSLSPEQGRQLLDDVRGDVHVMITLRSLPAQLGSAWSEYLKQGFRTGFEEWLEGVLADPPTPGLTPAYPARSDVTGVVRKWADLVGPERVTLLVLDPADRDLVPRTVETMLALAPGTLTDVALEGYDANRSFTLAEAELVRGLNQRARAREDLDIAQYLRLLRAHVVYPLLQRVPARDEARIVPPRWAADRVLERAEEHRRAVEALDVRVVGDLAGLAIPVAAADGPPPVPLLPLDAAAAAMVACVEAGLTAERRARRPLAVPRGQTAALADVPAAAIARVLARRARRAVRARLRR